MAELALREPDSSDHRRVTFVYERLLGRAPRVDELKDAASLLESLQPPQATRDPELYRWTVLVQAILASAEFRYVL